MPADLRRVGAAPGGGAPRPRPASAMTPSVRAWAGRSRLGGVAIAGRPARWSATPTATSALHAVADALLGADRRWATSDGSSRPTTATPRGIASAESWSRRCDDRVAARRLATGDRRPDDHRRRGRGWAPHLDAMRERDRGAARTRPRDAVNVKASSGNLDGAEGAGRVDLGARPSRRVEAIAMTLRLHDTLSGETATVRPAARRRSRRLLVRPDRLRPGPHRQLPLVPVRRPASCATCAGAATRVDLGDEHHRHRRQDHPRRRGDRRAHRRSSPTATSRRSWPTPTRCG